MHHYPQIVKPPVCTLRGSLSGKHSGRVFSLPFKGKNSCSIGKVTREIFLQVELQPLPGVPGFRQGDSRDAGDRKSTRLNSSHVANSYAVFCLKTQIST